MPLVRQLRRRLALTGAIGAAVLVLPAAVTGADAATPTSGTVTDTATTVTWTAGPFAVPNATGAAGAPTCSPATPCDDYTLTVSTPPGYGSGHQLSISVSWPNSAADFDLYVLDASGQTVGTSASSADPELVVLPPDSGTYTVRVVPYAPLGQSITGKAQLTPLPSNPPPATFPAPAYKNYAAPNALTDSHNAGEPSIGVNPKTGAVMYQSYLSTYRVNFGNQNPAQATWLDKSASATTGCPQGSTESLDPILFTDRSTGRTFESQLLGKAAATCYTDDDGNSWTPTQGSGINSGVDHQTIGGGPFAPGGTIGPLTSYKNAVYYCSQDIADASCAVSQTGGLTFGPAVPMYSTLDCGGLHGHVKVDPSSGTVYVPNKGCGANQAVAVSQDNGLTWAVRKVTGSTPGDSDPSVGIGHNGTVYFGYQGADGHARVSTSRDHGQSWVNGQDVGAQLGVKNVVFPAMVAGDDNRAAFAFIGSTTGGDYQNATTFHGVWHLYISTTIDGGAHWKTVDATPTDPVQKGSICTGGTTCGNDRNLLDFIDVTVDGQGRVLVGYADGCTGTCASGGAQNFDALATIARQTAGPRLFAAFDAAPDLTVAPPKASRSGSTVTLSAVVTNRGNKSASGVTVAFSNGTKTYGTTAGVTLAPGQSRKVTVTTTSIPPGKQGLTAVVDPKDQIAESNEGTNRARATIST
ncbi:MAG: CARDB domain-containing protein [Blastococcus sp.]